MPEMSDKSALEALEITPEMSEAGVAAFEQYQECFYAPALIAVVYRAMRRLEVDELRARVEELEERLYEIQLGHENL